MMIDDINNYFIVPGHGNSGPEHWQTYFESTGTNFKRIDQKDWNTPVCEDWVSNINNKISGCNPKSVILIGHSLGCSAIAHWAVSYKIKIKGAMLVAPSDVEVTQHTYPSTGFLPVVSDKLVFKSILVASSNDPWVSLDRARFFAANWGSKFIDIGNAGHINSASGYGNWNMGFEILKQLSKVP